MGGIDQVNLSEKTSITWPSQLTAWTSTAMALDFERRVTLITDLGELLDRYLFLALPGTAMKITKKNPAAKVRQGNYNMLRDI